MNCPPYPEYKSLGVEWLGDVPAHWKLKRLKFATACINDKQDATPEGLDYVAMEHIESWTGRRLDAGGLTPESQTSRFQRGDVLFGKLRPYLAKAWLADRDGICSTELLVLRERGLEPAYLRYWTLMRSFVEVVDGSTYGSKMPRASWDFIGNLPLLIPTREEQCAIVTFLDRETARIDALIAKKQRLIELLAEKRTALISHAVTKGLNPDAPMKDSGVEWLGEIPAHWKSGNIRRFALMRTGHTPNRNEPAYWEDCDIGWFTLADVWQLRDDRQIYLGETKERISQMGLANSAAELLPAGTVIFSRTASVGFSGIMPVAMATTQDFWNWIPGSQLTSDYLLYLFRAMRQEFARLTMGSTHKTIYQPDAARLRICVPPKPEQQAIVEFVRTETEKIDSLVTRVNSAIEKLKEYRAATISDAITGKIDVRSTGNGGWSNA